MAVSGDIEIAQNGGQSNIKLHPYFVALIRWCVSSVWSTATLMLHRLITTPLPPSTAPKPPKPRPASSDHLHPEPRVDCEVLHTPPVHTLDVIFVHGLYGSLGNTWRQGEWRSKYNAEPIKVPLRRYNSTSKNSVSNKDVICCTCDTTTRQDTTNSEYNENKERINESGDRKSEYENMFHGDEATFKNDERKFYADIRKILPKDNAFITEKFYNNTLLDQVEIVGNYETQANFVKDLFERDEKRESRDFNDRNENGELYKDCDCKVREAKCDVGCGCICDDCYSPCWPKDWIKVDYPGARVISINYTSDPYLWRPLWIKESKRLRLHERAEQMIAQLLALGVGERPIVWVGHSKGGLFIKQIYCEAYEAYQKIHNRPLDNETNENNEKRDQINNNEYSNENIFNHNIENNDSDNSTCVNNINIVNDGTRINDNLNNDIVNNDKVDNDKVNNDMLTECIYIENSIKEAFHFNDRDSDIDSNLIVDNIDSKRIFNDVYKSESQEDKLDIETFTDEEDAFNDGTDNENLNDENGNKIEAADALNTGEEKTSNEEEHSTLQARASLWKNSAGFMFYSVPHRGSPLADIKTPITARSVELMEICKDCKLVLSLQERWLSAAASSQPVVRSLVETCRTLMSVLWLRIVSVDSADPGIGSLCGVNVDHREICKPSSRSCLLYRELMHLMHGALSKFNDNVRL